MTLFCQRKPLHIFPVGLAGVKNGQQEKASPRGLLSAVSEMPTISPLLFSTGQATTLLAAAPPSAPRSIAFVVLNHNAAWPTLSPAKLARPVTQPRLLMLFAAPALPPRVGRVITLYVVCAMSQAGNRASRASASTFVKALDFIGFSCQFGIGKDVAF